MLETSRWGGGGRRCTNRSLNETNALLLAFRRRWYPNLTQQQFRRQNYTHCINKYQHQKKQQQQQQQQQPVYENLTSDQVNTRIFKNPIITTTPPKTTATMDYFIPPKLREQYVHPSLLPIQTIPK